MRAATLALVAILIAAASTAGWLGYRHWQALRSAVATLVPGPVEIGFAQSMSLHHQQAIALAQIMIDGRPIGMAHGMAFAQLEELGRMHGWLRLWNQPLQPPSPRMDWMRLGDTPPDAELTRYLLDCERSPSGMPGSVTAEDLAQLRQLQGPARDHRFLTLMLAHHEGALPMARFAAEQARLPAVRELAGRIVIDQAEEIGRIQRMLQVLDSAAAADPQFMSR